MIFFVFKKYWPVALFICISLLEHELKDNGVFCDKSIKEVSTYLNEQTEDFEEENVSGKFHIILKVMVFN